MLNTYNKIYEIVSNSQSVGKVWWDEKSSKIMSDNEQLLDYLKDKSYQDITWHDGPKFLQNLGNMLNNGYIFARTVKN